MTTRPDLSAVIDAVRIVSPSSTSPFHGEGHWRRVATNGLDLAVETGADPLLVVLFGIFHDSMRFRYVADAAAHKLREPWSWEGERYAESI